MTSKTYSSNLQNNYIQNLQNLQNLQNSRSPLYSSSNDNLAAMQSSTPYQGAYIFKERSGRLKWREIQKLDLDSMIKDNDISPLENYLENLIFSNIDETDLQIVPETSFLKLVKINQYVMEFLLDTQQRLEYENKILEVNYSQLVNEAITKENVLKENKSLINALKKDKKEKEIVLNTYKCLMDEYKSHGILAANNTHGMQSSNSSVVERKYFFCKFCEGKKFSSEENLDSHLRRRHARDVKEIYPGHHNESSSNNISKPKIEEKFEEMKSFFETYVKNFQNDSFMKLIEQQKNLEYKLIEMKSEKGNDIREIENTFKSTLLEMKEMYLKNSINQSMNQSHLLGNTGFVNPASHGSQAIHSPIYTEKSMRKDSDDDKKLVENEISAEKAVKKNIKKETKKMNETIKEISKEQNEKIEKLINQFLMFKESIVDEFKEIKEKSIVVPESVSDKNKMNSERGERGLRGQRGQREPTIISNVESIEIAKEQDSPRKYKLIKENVVEKTISNKKVLFNAGPLESDSEEEKEDLKYNKISREEMKFKNSSVNIESSSKEEIIDTKFSFAPNENLTEMGIIGKNPFNKGEDKREEPEKNPNIVKEETHKTLVVVENKLDIKENKADINTVPSEENEEKLPMEKALSINKLNNQEKQEKIDIVNQELVKDEKIEKNEKIEEIPANPINKVEKKKKIEKVIDDKNEAISQVEILDVEKIKQEELKRQEEENIKLKNEEKIKSKVNLEKFYHSFVTRDNKAIEKPKIELCIERIM